MIERYSPVGLKINFALENLETVASTKECIFNNIKYNIDQFGFELINRDIGTAYHIPEGILACYGELSNRYKSYINKKVDTCRVSPTILKIFGIDIPSYMQEPL